MAWLALPDQGLGTQIINTFVTNDLAERCIGSHVAVVVPCGARHEIAGAAQDN